MMIFLISSGMNKIQSDSRDMRLVLILQRLRQLRQLKTTKLIIFEHKQDTSLQTSLATTVAKR